MVCPPHFTVLTSLSKRHKWFWEVLLHFTGIIMPVKQGSFHPSINPPRQPVKSCASTHPAIHPASQPGSITSKCLTYLWIRWDIPIRTHSVILEIGTIGKSLSWTSVGSTHQSNRVKCIYFLLRTS